jgi:hypothetical protein
VHSVEIIKITFKGPGCQGDYENSKYHP